MLTRASFIGFTGTPIDIGDKSTTAIFGDTIDTYDIERSIADGATVPIYYEARLGKIALKDEELPRIDPEFEEVAAIDSKQVDMTRTPEDLSQPVCVLSQPLRRLAQLLEDLSQPLQRLDRTLQRTGRAPGI